eukprot:g7068.t1
MKPTLLCAPTVAAMATLLGVVTSGLGKPQERIHNYGQYGNTNPSADALIHRWGSVQTALEHMGTSWQQLQCNTAYKALFPGTTAQDAGPCREAMTLSFSGNSCTKGCGPTVERMLSACIDLTIPDVPAGNPLAGKLFTIDRAEGIRSAMIKAGCTIDFIQILKARRPTQQPTPAPGAHVGTLSPTPAPPTPAPTPCPTYTVTVELWGETL